MKEAHHTSIWEGTSGTSSYPQLTEEIKTDVAIVGAGITGLTAAYLLKKAGKKVVVLESQHVGAGTTGHTTAHLTTEYDHDYSELQRAYGDETCQLVSRSLRDAIDIIEQIVDEQDIDCSFRRLRGYYYTENEEGVETIDKEYETIRSLDLYDAEMVETVPLPFSTYRGYAIDNQAQMHPMPYLYALAKAVHQDGSQVFESTRVTDFSRGFNPVVTTTNGKIHAKSIILATHTPLGRSALHALVAPYRSYVIAFTLKSGAAPDGLFWDTADPYNYIRQQETDHGTMVIVGGQDKKVGHGKEEEAFASLEAYARARFDIAKIHYQWSAQLYEPADHLPFIGKLPVSAHVYTGTGYSGDGMTLGTLAGHMLANQIVGKATPYDKIYQPTRIKIQGINHFVKENLDNAKQFIGDRLPFVSNKGAITQLGNGDGAVLPIEGNRVAAVRDEHGELKLFDAVCPHMRCLVHWNAAQKTFDCPCHGSRFDTDGQVLEGPCLSPLTRLHEAEEKIAHREGEEIRQTKKSV